MATAKKIRKLSLDLRQGSVTNLNLVTEKHGDELVSRCDISLGFTVKDMEVDELISAKGNPLQLLWHTDKSVMFRDVDSIPVGFKAEGTLQVGVSDEHLVGFDNALLKKIVVTPFQGLQAGVKCQVRVDPTGHLEALDEMLITGDVVCSFSGEEAIKEDSQQGLDV